MAGTLGLACLLAATVAQARVQIASIKVCILDPQEVGHDEVYLKFNGTRVNVGSISGGDCGTYPYYLIVPSTPFHVELWESDGNHWYDQDDFFEGWDNEALSPPVVSRIYWDPGDVYYQYEFWASVTP
jgi:hypothetical protein